MVDAPEFEVGTSNLERYCANMAGRNVSVLTSSVVLPPGEVGINPQNRSLSKIRLLSDTYPLQLAKIQLIGVVYDSSIYLVFGLAGFFFGPTIFKGTNGARSG
jgi:hypothetical protein